MIPKARSNYRNLQYAFIHFHNKEDLEAAKNGDQLNSIIDGLSELYLILTYAHTVPFQNMTHKTAEENVSALKTDKLKIYINV